MKQKNPILILLAAGLWLTAVHAQEVECFRWDAKINGQPARLILDTGSSPPLVLFRPAVERLGLRFKSELQPAAENSPAYWLTEDCTTDLPGWAYWVFWSHTLHLKMPLAVLDSPAWVGHEIPFDGLVGWPLICRHITQLDATKQKFTFLKRVPKEATGWTQWTVRAATPKPEEVMFELPNPDGSNTPVGQAILRLELPNPDGSKGIILVDTGGLGVGVGLPSRKWREWKAVHTNAPTWLVLYWLDAGVTIQEQGWAAQLPLGSLKLTDVAVEEEAVSPFLDLAAKDYVARLGFAALKRLDCIVDGQNGVAYLRPKQTPAQPPSFGTRCLAFAPRGTNLTDLVAAVINGSPASQAGIRNGDVLLKIDQRNVAQWREHPGEQWHAELHPGFIWVPATNRAAGTNLTLSLKRGDRTFDATVARRGLAIVAPPPQTNPPPSHSKSL